MPKSFTVFLVYRVVKFLSLVSVSFQKIQVLMSTRDESVSSVNTSPLLVMYFQWENKYVLCLGALTQPTANLAVLFIFKTSDPV